MANQTSKKPTVDFNLKEISPSIGALNDTRNDGITTGTDLIEFTLFLYVKVVRARVLPGIYGRITRDLYVEVKVGEFKGTPLWFSRMLDPKWNQVFALEKVRIQEPTLEIVVKSNYYRYDKVVGQLSFAISDIPVRFPTESSLATQWYRIEDDKGKMHIGELMLSLWVGTQADEAFHEACQLDVVASINIFNIANTRSQTYLTPRIWCLRGTVIEAQDLLLQDKTENSKIFVIANLGSWTFRTKLAESKNGKPKWNEDLFIAVAEPFHQDLILSVELGTSKNHKSLGKCRVSLKNVNKRLDGAPAAVKWYNLERPKIIEDEQDEKFASRLSMRLALDGGYHIFDEDPEHTSDLNATSKKLWESSIGVFEMGILNATGLPAMKKGNRTDAYCVAKYGLKWVRTRTIVDSLSPKWNEQYSWDVYDPCTFITVAVFDNGQLQKVHKAEGEIDTRIGKVRISLSELILGRIYTCSYPLIELQPTGLKKMGEIQLAFRLFCPNAINFLKIYTLPKLPRLHYASPLSSVQLSGLRKQKIVLISSRMSKAEPALRREVVEYMLDSHQSAWSFRRVRADMDRIKNVVSGLEAMRTQYDQICKWKNHISTLIIFVVFFVVIIEPGLLLPAMFFCLFLDVLLQYQKRPTQLSHVDVLLSHVHTASTDELEEEFDPIPSKFEDKTVNFRYNRLRAMTGKFVTQMGNFATNGEKLQSLLSWQDPAATLLFMISCLITGFATLIIPFRAVISFWFLYLLRHPRFRSPLPAFYENWVSRMPSKLDKML